MSEKTEKATPYKLRTAKEKGQASRSVEVTTCITLLVLLSMVTALWPRQLHEIQNLTRHTLYLASHMQFSIENIHHLHQFILSKIINLWLPFALAGVLSNILVNVSQSGIIWSATPITPDFKRINIVQGFKKLFSIKTCFETVKSTLKLIASFIFLFFTFRYQLPHLLQLVLSRVTGAGYPAPVP